MRLDKAGGDELSLGVDLHRVRGDLDLHAFARRRLRLALAHAGRGLGFHVDDLFARDRHQPVLDQAERALAGGILRAGHGGDPSVADEQGGGGH